MKLTRNVKRAGGSQQKCKLIKSSEKMQQKNSEFSAGKHRTPESHHIMPHIFKDKQSSQKSKKKTPEIYELF